MNREEGDASTRDPDLEGAVGVCQHLRKSLYTKILTLPVAGLLKLLSSNEIQTCMILLKNEESVRDWINSLSEGRLGNGQFL